MTHRVDPPIHTSRKGNIKKVSIKGRSEEGKQLSSRRKAPAISAGKGNRQVPTTGGRRRKPKDQDDDVIGHVKFKASTAKPKQEILDRLRRRIAASAQTTRSEDESNVKVSCNKMHGSGDSEKHKAMHDESKDHRISTRSGFMDQLMKLAASQKMEKKKCVKPKLNLCKVQKNSISCMYKGRTFTRGPRHPRDSEALGQGSKRSEAAAVDGAIARLLSAGMPPRPTPDMC